MPETTTRHRTTAYAGLASFALLFAGQGLIQVGGAEPPFDAPMAQTLGFFNTRDEALFAIGSYLSVLSVVAMLWFFGGVYALLRDDWRAMIALVSGVIYAAGTISVDWELATFRAGEGLDPQVARLVFDMGNLGFASAWVALGSFALATGWVLLGSPRWPNWLGWWATAAGVCLVAGRAVWTNQFWLVGYFLIWIWIVVLCVQLLRRPYSAG
jgi:hypothetical protein